MVSARLRILGADGPFARLRTALADTVAAATSRTDSASPLILDVGSGTGQYAATALDQVPMALSIGIDLSKSCARETARAHERLAAIVADAWQRLPVGDAVVDAVTSVFAPRNVPEFARVLRPGGHLIVAAPEPGHLGQLIEPMGMLRVGEDKYEALVTATADAFRVQDSVVVEYPVKASAQTVADLTGMGPSAFHHTSDEIDRRASEFVGDATVTTTVSVRVTTLTRNHPSHSTDR